MENLNELLMWWYIWVNGNYDILIMTITLIVVAGLVLEVVRLKGRIEAIEVRADWNVEDLNNRLNHLDDAIETARLGWYTHESKLDDQVNVNVHLAEDIDRLDKKINQLKMCTDAWGIKLKTKKK